MPSLLHIKAVTILDGALKEVIVQKGLLPPKNSLHARLEILGSQGLLADTPSLHAVRDRRNDLAHEFEETIDWVQLESDVQEIQRALEHLGSVGARTPLAFTSERSAARNSSEPGVICHFDYRFMVKDGDWIAAEVRWTENLMKSNQG